jgi:hypothetical protein
MALPRENVAQDTTDARRGWVTLAHDGGTNRARAFRIGWVAVHRVYGPREADGRCRGLYRLTHIPSGAGICDVAERTIHIPYAIATRIVTELPDAPNAGTLGADLLFEIVAVAAVGWIVMLPQDDYGSLVWPREAVAS